jgi:hypothetical protein
VQFNTLFVALIIYKITSFRMKQFRWVWAVASYQDLNVYTEIHEFSLFLLHDRKVSGPRKRTYWTQFLDQVQNHPVSHLCHNLPVVCVQENHVYVSACACFSCTSHKKVTQYTCCFMLVSLIITTFFKVSLEKCFFWYSQRALVKHRHPHNMQNII